MDKSPLTPLPPTLPLEPPEELELLLPEDPEEELEDPVDFFTSLLVSFAMVIRPTEPSLARPLLLWKLLTALSVLSPKYPVTLEEDKYPYLLSRFWTCLTLSP